MAEKVRQWDHRIAKAFMEDLPPEVRDRMATSYRDLPSVADDVRRYVSAVRAGTGDDLVAPSRTMGVLTSDQAARFEQIKHLSVDLFDVSIDPSSIRHEVNEHGNLARETRRGQKPAEADDYAVLPQVISHGTIADEGRSWRTGLPLVSFTYRIGAHEYHAVFERRPKRRTLALTSFVVRKRRSS